MSGPERGELEVGDGNAIAWWAFGAENGKPAVVLHGGPGQGSSPNMVRAFDLAHYRVVIFDQRGCGQSTPHASSLATDMSVNTTRHLVADMELLRAHLGFERWLVSGGSWGCTLALAYAERHPERVSEIVLSALTLSGREDSEWLYRGVARFFPEAWERFSSDAADGDVIEDYARRMEHPDLAVRLAAARAWCAWEDAVLSLEPHAVDSGYAGMEPTDMLALVRICTHYVRHAAWLEEDEIVRNANILSKIPGVIIHGRRDMSCPVEGAVALARAWPAAKLIVLEDSGHLRSDSKRAALVRAYADFAK